MSSKYGKDTVIVSLAKEPVHKNNFYIGQIIKTTDYYPSIGVIDYEVVVSRIWNYEGKQYIFVIDIHNHYFKVLHNNGEIVSDEILKQFYTELCNARRLIEMGYKSILHLP